MKFALFDLNWPPNSKKSRNDCNKTETTSLRFPKRKKKKKKNISKSKQRAYKLSPGKTERQLIRIKNTQDRRGN